VLSKVADSQYMLLTLLEAPVLAFLLAFLIRYFEKSAQNPKYTLFSNENLPVYIFMSVIVAIFMGLTVSAEEIIKDRKILKREAFLNLSWNSYLLSKVFVQLTISAIQALTFVLIGNAITGIKGMWFEYWIVLFSCWAGANIMGLVISDSFKAVATIYMWIPFLVIPQIILSGVMVKFEKLNPIVTTPVSIPFYGEFITARWGYEALAVKQFKDNRYEKQFYAYDKSISKAKFKRDWWYDAMNRNLDYISNGLSGNISDEFTGKLRIVYNEFKKEKELLPDIRFEYLESLTPEKITADVVIAAQADLELIKKAYIAHYNNINTRRENLLNKLQSENKEEFFKLRNAYTNEKLEEFVINRNETQSTIEYKGEIFQNREPIYMDPNFNFIKAHFYAPVKKIFGLSVDTFVMNILVLWVITIGLYMILSFRLLKKLLDSGEVIMGKKLKGSE